MAVRNLRQGLIVFFAIIFVLIVVVFAVRYSLEWAVGTNWFADRGAAYLSERLFADESTRMRIGSLEGHIWSRIDARDVVIEVKDGSEWVPWLEIEGIYARYNLGELAEERHHVRAVRVYGARLHLPRGYETKPKFAASRDKSPKPERAVTDVTRLTIDELKIAGSVGARHGNAFSDFECSLRLDVGGGFVAIDLVESDIRLGEYPEMHASGPVEIRGDSVYLEALTVVGGDSKLAIAGALDGRQRAQLRVELEPLSLKDVAEATGWGLPAEGGWVRGVARVEGDWSNLEMVLDLASEIGTDRLEAIRGHGRLANGTLSVDELSLELEGVPLSGEGSIAFRRGAESWGRVRFSDAALKVFPVLRDQGWLPDGELSGALRVGSSVGGTRPFKLEVDRGDVRGFAIEPGLFEGSVDDVGFVRLDSVDIVTRGAVLHGGGTIDPREGLDLTHDLEVFDLVAFGSMLGEERLAGAGRMRVAIIGPFASPAFSVNGHLDSLSVGAVRLDDVDLAVGPGILRRDITTDLDIIARGGTIAGHPVGRLVLGGNIRDDRLRIASLDAEVGNVSLDLRGRVAWGGGQPAFRVDRLAAVIGDDTWQTLEPFAGRARSGVWELDPVVLGSPVGVLRAGGRYDVDSRTIDVGVSGQGLDLSRLETEVKGSPAIGRVNFDARARGPAAAPTLVLQLDAGQLGTTAFAVDSLLVESVIDSTGIKLDRLYVDQGGEVEVSGTVGFAEALTPVSAARLLASRSGWESAVLDLSATSNGADITAWHGLSDTVDRVQGAFAFLVRLAGTPLDPSGKATVGTSRLVVDDEVFTDVDALLTLDDGWIHIDHIDTVVRESRVGAIGRMPVHFSLMEPTDLNHEAPIDLTLEFDPGDLSLSSYVTDKVIDASGPVSGVVNISGSIEMPIYRGKLEVTGGELRLTGREEVLQDLHTAIVLSSDRVEFENIRARSRDDGRVTGGGVLYLAGGRADGFDFNLDFQKFPLRSTGEYLAQVTGSIDWTQERGFPKPLPVVDARIRLNRLDYLREVVGGDDDAVSAVSSWTGRVAVDIPRHLWIRNQDMEAELKGDVTYEQRATSATLLGELEVIRGTYGLFGHTFRITEGSVRFVDPEKIDPDLNVEAEARTPEGRVQITVTGRASDRQVTLESDDANLDQATLWSILVPGDSSEMSNLVAMTPFIRDLERRISQEIPGLSVSLEMTDRETGEAGGVGARVGTYVSPEMFVSGYQGFTSTVDQEVSIEYQLSDLFFVSGDAERRGLREGNDRDIQEEYNINLNFRYEF